MLDGAGLCHLSEPEQLVLDGVCQLLQERLHGFMQQPDACCAALCAGKVPARAKRSPAAPGCLTGGVQHAPSSPQRAETYAEAYAANDFQGLSLAQVVHVEHCCGARGAQRAHELADHLGNAAISGPERPGASSAHSSEAAQASQPNVTSHGGSRSRRRACRWCSPHVLQREGRRDALAHKPPLRRLAALRQQVGQPGSVADLRCPRQHQAGPSRRGGDRVAEVLQPLCVPH